MSSRSVTAGPETDVAAESVADRATVCIFAPVTLLTITVEATSDSDSELHVHAGGQGVWIARMAVTLGARSELVTSLGGETGRVARRLLEEEGISVSAVETAHPTAAWIQDRRTGERVTFWESVPKAMGRHEHDELYSLALAGGLNAGTVAMAGTHQADGVMPDETYGRLATDLHASDVEVVVDVTGGQLDAVVGAGVSVVKVSADDLVRDGLAETSDERHLMSAAERLAANGATVVVSRAGDGALAVRGDTTIMATAPELEVIDTRGAGDSMTGAIAVAAARGMSWEDALRLATAAGAVNVTRHGSGSGRSETIEALAERVEIRYVSAR